MCHHNIPTAFSTTYPQENWTGPVRDTKKNLSKSWHDLVVISFEKTSSVLTQACERGTLRQVCVQAVIDMDRESEVGLQ